MRLKTQRLEWKARAREAWWRDKNIYSNLGKESRLGELSVVFYFVFDWLCVVLKECMSSFSLWRCFTQNSGNLPRNRLAGMQVPPGGTSVWPNCVVSAMNCLAVGLSRQAMYAVLTLFDWTVLYVALCWL